jgi:hypothetical protein
MTNKKSDQKPAKGKPTMAAEPKKPEMPIAPPKQEVQQTAAPTPPATTQRSVFEDYGAAMRQRHWIGRLLKYDKGDYLAGQEDELIPLGTQLAACMDTLSVGWVIWEDGRAIEHHMGLVIDRFKAPPRSALGYLDKNLWALDAMGNPRDPAQFTNYLVVRVCPSPKAKCSRSRRAAAAASTPSAGFAPDTVKPFCASILITTRLSNSGVTAMRIGTRRSAA